MNKWQNSFVTRIERVYKTVKPLKHISSKNIVTTQNESNFLGEMLSDFQIKMFYYLALLGPIGILYPFIITIRKVKFKEKDVYLYSDISRNKAEKIALLALILTIFYAIIIYYFVQEFDAERLDEIYYDNKS